MEHLTPPSMAAIINGKILFLRRESNELETQLMKLKTQLHSVRHEILMLTAHINVLKEEIEKVRA